MTKDLFPKFKQPPLKTLEDEKQELEDSLVESLSGKES